MNRDNRQHIRWIYDRLIFVHKENPKADYMLRFLDIIDDLDITNGFIEKKRHDIGSNIKQ